MTIRTTKRKITKRKNPGKLSSLHNKRVTLKTGHAYLKGVLKYYLPLSTNVPLEYSMTYEVKDGESNYSADYVAYFYEKDVDTIYVSLITIKNKKKNLAELF